MGIESYFVSILPPNLNVLSENGMKNIVGSDMTYNLCWKDALSSVFNLKVKTDYYVIDSCIEFYLKETLQGGKYIDLVGCLSCFHHSIPIMNRIIKSVYEKTLLAPIIYCGGEVYNFTQIDFTDILLQSYSSKFQMFMERFNTNMITCPSNFYKDYKNPIKKLFSSKHT